MSDLKEAYETLGLPENASREDVEKAFDIVLRQSRGRNSGAEADEGYQRKLRAYKQIVGEEERRSIEDMTRRRYAKWGRFAGAAERRDDFFRLHRTKLLIGLLALVVLIGAGVAFVNHRAEQQRLAALPPLDLSIMYLGSFMTDEAKGGIEGLQEALVKSFPDWKRVEASVTYLPMGESGTGDAAYLQKAVVTLASERPDIYILDQSSFDWISQSGGLLNLDAQSAGEWKALLPEGAKIVGRMDEDQDEHVYGIDVTNSPLVKDLPLSGRQLIVAIRDGADRTDKAVAFITRYLQAEQ